MADRIDARVTTETAVSLASVDVQCTIPPDRANLVICTRGATSFNGTVDSAGTITSASTSAFSQWITQCARFQGGQFTLEQSGYCVAPTLPKAVLNAVAEEAQAKASQTARIPTEIFDAAQIIRQQPAKVALALTIGFRTDVPPALIVTALYDGSRMAIKATKNQFTPATWRAEIARPEFATQWAALRGDAPIRADDPAAKILAIALRTRRTLDNIGLPQVRWATDVAELTPNQLAALRWAYQRPADTADARDLARAPLDTLGDDAQNAGILDFAANAAAIQGAINQYRQRPAASPQTADLPGHASNR